MLFPDASEAGVASVPNTQTKFDIYFAFPSVTTTFVPPLT